MIMIRTACAALAAILFAGPVMAQAPTPTEGAWKSAPTAQDLAKVYPPRAKAAKLGGTVTIQCALAVTGRLQACGVVGETPRGYGFGAAALSLADKFAMEPKIVQGRPVAGATVRIPVTFRLPDQATKV
jgi:protein TonB